MNRNQVFSTLVALSLATMILQPEVFSADAQDEPRRNPFRFAEDRQADPVESFTLEMTLVNDSRAVAVFNGKAYRIGERLGEYVITRIEPGSVKARKKNDLKIFTISGPGK